MNNSTELSLENLIYVRYLDHLLFKNTNPLQYGPVVREAVGWLVREEPRAICMVTDPSVESELERFWSSHFEVRHSGNESPRSRDMQKGTRGLTTMDHHSGLILAPLVG